MNSPIKRIWYVMFEREARELNQILKYYEYYLIRELRTITKDQYSNINTRTQVQHQNVCHVLDLTVPSQRSCSAKENGGLRETKIEEDRIADTNYLHISTLREILTMDRYAYQATELFTLSFEHLMPKEKVDRIFVDDVTKKPSIRSTFVAASTSRSQITSSSSRRH